MMNGGYLPSWWGATRIGERGLKPGVGAKRVSSAGGYHGLPSGQRGRGKGFTE